ncbi:heat shock protein HspQ [Planctomycetota bacterium]
MQQQLQILWPAFCVGQVVHHRRYDYRGVVFDFDPCCRANEEWYQQNLTQPDRDQPWYHVLVHGATHTTYVAQENLEPDRSLDPVEHPLVERVFSTFHAGRYYREHSN